MLAELGVFAGFEFTRLVDAGDEVIVTYEATKTDGHRFRNTDVLTFDGGQLCQAEVYFGWDLHGEAPRNRTS